MANRRWYAAWLFILGVMAIAIGAFMGAGVPLTLCVVGFACFVAAQMLRGDA